MFVCGTLFGCWCLFGFAQSSCVAGVVLILVSAQSNFSGAGDVLVFTGVGEIVVIVWWRVCVSGRQELRATTW